MAPNGSVAGRKTPAASKSAKQPAITLEKLFDDLEDETELATKKSVKNALPSFKKPGAWDSEVIPGKKPKEQNTRGQPRMNKLPEKFAKAFSPAQPMSDRPVVLKCNHCKRTVAKYFMHAHIEDCIFKKQEKQRKKKEAKDARDAAARKERTGTGTVGGGTGGAIAADSEDDDDDGEPKAKPATATATTGEKNGGTSDASKKRKAVTLDVEDAEAATAAAAATAAGLAAIPPPRKKKKKDDRTKVVKPKLPVDVEKQCGVELPNGGLCARSLTCKSHSMGAKRAVRRSAPYDKLLMEYQRKNQAKMQKAQFDASAPNPEDENLPTGPVDSDEEKEAMMSAIQRSWGGRPIYECTPAPLRSKYQHNRIKGMLQAALGGRGGASLFGTVSASAAGSGGGGVSGSAGGSATSVTGMGFFGPSFASSYVDEPRPMTAAAARRASVASGHGRSMLPPGAESRRQSVAAT